MKKILFAFLATTALSIPSFANLLTNGNFDQTDSRVGLVNGRRLDQLSANWDVYTSIPGWTTQSGRGIEVQASGTVVNAQSGNLYIELDSHPNNTNSGSTNSIMFQTVNLGIGDYILSFYYRPRTDTPNDNGIQARIDTQVLLDLNAVTSTLNTWTKYSALFSVTTAGNKNVTFEATGLANQLGGFIDTVSLLERTSTTTNETVPEPSTFALLGASLLGLGYKLRRR
ncbi:MAG: PEP-CTERM sorting domain-containing protein [Acidobacteria bacterium]|nr:PEP-CTERM sorting domain-containing protein [Acidobacteriota bacterium]